MPITTSDVRGSELQALVDDVYEKYAPLNEGAVATYIPELAKADAGAFGVCIATAEGQVFESGDCDHAFTIQSISKPFTFGMALEAYRVGVPAKSGVAGGVIAVVNRQLGIGTYSPRLDAFGNSRRGTEVCADMASRLGLHVCDCLNVGSSFLSAVI